MDIIVDDLKGQAIRSLITEHLQGMQQHSPPESIHALPLAELQAPNITFWSAWINQTLVGCGALKALSSTHGEIKSMRTVSKYLKQGVASQILQHIIYEAKQRHYHQLSLETGSMSAFLPAKKLYQKFGFVDCPPFDDYIEDPNSVFMTLSLS